VSRVTLTSTKNDVKGQFHQHVLRAAFTLANPKSVKIQSSCQCLFALLEPALVNAACKTLLKLTPGHSDS